MTMATLSLHDQPLSLHDQPLSLHDHPLSLLTTNSSAWALKALLYSLAHYGIVWLNMLTYDIVWLTVIIAR